MPLLRRLGNGWPTLLLLTATMVGRSPLAAQSLTSGSLRGLVQTTNGVPIAGVHVALESSVGGTVRQFETERDGAFNVSLIAPGDYRVLVEQIGYQPVRRSGIVVVPGRLTTVVIALERKPPPITNVTEINQPTGAAGMTHGRLVTASELSILDRRRDIGDVSRGITEVLGSVDGREGFAIAADGLPATYSRFVIDGVQESLLRHPAWPDDPVRTPVFHRDGVSQVQVMGVPLDGEWHGAPGSQVSVQTRSGTNRLSFQPYASFSSAKLGTRPLDNPFDSTGSSLQVGAALSGALVQDTAHFLLRFDYQSLELPSSYTAERDSAVYQGQFVSLHAALPQIASDSFGTQINSLVSPPIKSYKGASGFGRLDWQLGTGNALVVRAGYAGWKERGFPVGSDLAPGVGNLLDARDISAAISLTSSGEDAANELRGGVNIHRRDWTGSSVPSTTIVSNGAAIGSSATLPGLFDLKTFDISNAYQRVFGSHRFKIGVNLTANNYTQNYRFGSAGVFTFGDLDNFGAGRGAFFQVTGPNESAQFTTTDFGAFLQDTWTVTPEIQILAGIRYENQSVPKNKILLNTTWQTLTGIRNDSIPTDKRGVSPRVGFVWDVQNRGEWLIRGGGGVYKGGLDPSILSEAILLDKDARVRRGIADFATWPVIPDASLAPDVGERLTVINSTYRAPRTTKVEFGVTRNLSQATFHIVASYHHTDYLLRRQDLNRLTASVGTTQEGRPVYGTLIQQGGLVAPVVGSNRRFSEFDLVSGLVPTGYTDHYEVTAILERQVSQNLSVSASYTFSKTTDNMIGARTADPADQLNPFPDGLNGAEWAKGRSDFDVPHRGAITLAYRSRGSLPITLAGRYRVRSGLPFTPGFQPGVDANADGGGNNDPAFLDPSLSGLQEAYQRVSCDGTLNSAFAVRNSCREKIQHSLDAHLDFALPVGQARDRLFLQVDAFNLYSTPAGLVDRALVMVDPNGSLSTDAAGNVTIPLVANPHFGSLLIRRGEPRTVRVGIRMEY